MILVPTNSPVQVVKIKPIPIFYRFPLASVYVLYELPQTMLLSNYTEKPFVSWQVSLWGWLELTLPCRSSSPTSLTSAWLATLHTCLSSTSPAESWCTLTCPRQARSTKTRWSQTLTHSNATTKSVAFFSALSLPSSSSWATTVQELMTFTQVCFSHFACFRRYVRKRACFAYCSVICFLCAVALIGVHQTLYRCLRCRLCSGVACKPSK